VEVYRYDPVDMPLPPHRDFVAMVNAASTEDNANMRGFLDDHVFFVQDVVRDGHPTWPISRNTSRRSSVATMRLHK